MGSGLRGSQAGAWEPGDRECGCSKVGLLSLSLVVKVEFVEWVIQKPGWLFVSSDGQTGWKTVGLVCAGGKLFGEADGHLEGVGAVVVIAGGKVAKLVG